MPGGDQQTRWRPAPPGGAGRGGRGGKGRGSASKAPRDPHQTLRDAIADATKVTKNRTPEWEQEHWKRIKAMVRGSDTLSSEAFDCLMAQLRHRTPAVRRLSLGLLDRLFTRCVQIRESSSRKIKDIVDLTVAGKGGLGRDTELRRRALEVLEGWIEVYGCQYAELRVARQYLRDVNGVALLDAQGRARREAAERAERKREAENVITARYTSDKRKVGEVVDETKGLLRQLECCFSIVVPDLTKGLEDIDHVEREPAITAEDGDGRQVHGLSDGIHEDDDDIDWEVAADPSGQADSEQQAHEGDQDAKDEWWEDGDIMEWAGCAGLGSTQYEIEVDVPSLLDTGAGLETAELQPVFACLREGYRVLKGRLVPYMERWAELLKRVRPLLSSDSDEASTCVQLLARVEQVKEEASETITKCEQIMAEPGADKRSKRKRGPHVELEELQMLLKRSHADSEVGHTQRKPDS